MQQQIRRYSEIQQFAIDKALNVYAEELFAPFFIKGYWRDKGLHINRVDKNLGDLKTERLYDLRDSTGTTWEVKTDKRCLANTVRDGELRLATGNVYIELQSRLNCQADKYLIYAGLAYIVDNFAFNGVLEGRTSLAGGDRHSVLGVPLPIELIADIAEAIYIDPFTRIK